MVNEAMTYAQLFAAVGQRFGGTYRIEVGTWRHVSVHRAPSADTAWSISWQHGAKFTINTGATAKEAFEAFVAALAAQPAGPDATGVGDLVDVEEIE